MVIQKKHIRFWLKHFKYHQMNYMYWNLGKYDCVGMGLLWGSF